MQGVSVGGTPRPNVKVARAQDVSEPFFLSTFGSKAFDFGPFQMPAFGEVIADTLVSSNAMAPSFPSTSLIRFGKTLHGYLC